MAIWLPRLEGRSGPKYLQIVDAMAEDIASGHLQAGARLPPHRELAFQIDVSANTASRAYAEAVKRGLLRGEIGRGSFVRSPDTGLDPGEQGDLRRDNDGPIDLSRNLPLPGFAEPHIQRALEDLQRSGRVRALLDYQTEQDLAHHSEAGAAWLKMCGVEAGTDQVVATMGGQHGLLCTLMALSQPGDLLLTECLTYMPVCAMAERLGLHTATVGMDAQGVDPEAFEALCKQARPRAFYLTPTLQAPTTLTLSAPRRHAIAEIADRYGVILIEDDVFGPLKPDRPPALAASAPDHTVYVTSLSKAVAPGLRVGFLHAPKSLIPALRNAVNLSVWMTPPMVLEVAGRMIKDGTAAGIAAKQRAAARHRQSLAQTILDRTDIVADPDGLHLWMPLPDNRRSDILRSQCARHGVLISEGRSFAPDISTAPEAVRICLSHEVDERRLEQGLQTLADLLRTGPVNSAFDI